MIIMITTCSKVPFVSPFVTRRTHTVIWPPPNLHFSRSHLFVSLQTKRRQEINSLIVIAPWNVWLMAADVIAVASQMPHWLALIEHASGTNSQFITAKFSSCTFKGAPASWLRLPSLAITDHWSALDKQRIEGWTCLLWMFAVCVCCILPSALMITNKAQKILWTPPYFLASFCS